MTPVRLAALLALIAAAAPLVAAAPVSGVLEITGTLDLPRGARVEAPGGEWLWEADAPPEIRIEAAAVRVTRIGNVNSTPVEGSPIFLTSGQIDEESRHAESILVLRAGSGVQLVAARADAVRAEVAAASVRPVAAGVLVQSSEARMGACDGIDCLETAGTHEILGPLSNLTLEGEITILLHGPTLVVREGGREETYASGVTKDSEGPVRRQEEVLLIAHLSGARAIVESSASPARLFLAAPVLDAPAAIARDASGTLQVGARSYRAADDFVETAGALKILPDPTVAESRSFGVRFTYAPGFSARVQGEVAAINLDAVPVYEEAPAEAAGALVGVAALLAAVAYYWPLLQFHGTAALLPLYTRLNQPHILDNDVRNAIYEIIRLNPGISARAIHRLSDQSWGTVVYHLRQLERHHVVVSRALGRTRNYYENHGKYRGMEVQLACLQNERARVLARIVAHEPGITQEILAERSGYPQPTTSYYVLKLKRAGLLDEAREGKYVRYNPREELPRFLEIAEHDPSAAAPPPEAPAGPVTP